MLNLPVRARYPPVTRVNPTFSGITWKDHEWIIMPLRTFIEIHRYAANLAERNADNVTWKLLQDAHLMKSASYETYMRTSRSFRQEVLRIEENISNIYEKIIEKSAFGRVIFHITFPYNFIRQSYLIITDEEGHIEEELLILSDFDSEFLENSLPSRPS
jgi:hypothetical protein